MILNIKKLHRFMYTIHLNFYKKVLMTLFSNSIWMPSTRVLFPFRNSCYNNNKSEKQVLNTHYYHYIPCQQVTLLKGNEIIIKEKLLSSLLFDDNLIYNFAYNIEVIEPFFSINIDVLFNSSSRIKLKIREFIHFLLSHSCHHGLHYNF